MVWDKKYICLYIREGGVGGRILITSMGSHGELPVVQYGLCPVGGRV